MRIAKTWLWAAMFMAFLGGTAVIIGMSPGQRVTAEEKVIGDHWAFHDGHWSFWHAGDRRWYYTDGVHWFWNDGRAWMLYRFDRLFGRGFEHGPYKVPGPGIEIALPRHEVHHPR